MHKMKKAIRIAVALPFKTNHGRGQPKKHPHDLRQISEAF